jgi:hypothetical protein
VRLPGLDRVVIAERKVAGYLLALEHPTGRHKALWLLAHGFRAETWEALAAAIKHHAATHEVARVEDSPFGKRYVVEGSFVTPDGRNPLIRSVWFVENSEDSPQLVTIYPLRGTGT